MRNYNGLWGDGRLALIGALLAAGCAHAPQTYPVSVPPSAPPPVTGGEWAATGEPVQLREDAPLTYVVKKGDTLWDIANHFLLDPWQWPEIWVVNSQVRNPHLIYPGDTLTLRWTNGKPGVTLSGDSNKLSPHIRESSLESAIPTIPIDAIRDFLQSPRVVTEEQIKKAPYVVEFVDSHIVGGAEVDVFVKKLISGGLTHYDAVRLGERYIDPDTHEVLGWEALPVGSADVRELGTASTPGVATMSKTTREVRVGDYFVKPPPSTFETAFYPHAPKQPIRGRILSVFDGVSEIGQYAVVTLNKGAANGIEPGHILSILQAGRSARDPYTQHTDTLPETYAGLVMVFKVESRVSYALVMKATREVHVLDYVAKPTSEQH